MTKVSVKTTRNNAILRRLDATKKAVAKLVTDEIEASTITIQDEATAAVKATAFKKTTGFLASSIYQAIDKKKIIGEVGATANYAPYIEFGTGTLVDIPQGLEDYASEFKGAGIRQVNLPARPFLFPSFRAETPELVKRINSGMKRILK